MTRGRDVKREPTPDPAALDRLIIHHRGRKAVRDEDLACRFGLTLEQMYRRLGRKLLLFSRSCWFEVQAEKQRAAQSRAAIAFTLSGIIMVSASLGMEHALAVGLEILPLLKNRRRSSKYKQRRLRRALDPTREASYQRVFATLQAQMIRLLER